ncbi:MAG: hypothetical protein EA426_03205 [Spirochaetaceae bacterium]|nr:MAG: hypothetical protein EA426_03205 [Spirochaetaceae bacterium]
MKNSRFVGHVDLSGYRSHGIINFMKTVDVSRLQRRLGSFLAEVERGETIEVSRRRKVIARIVPVAVENPAPWPDLAARVNALFPEGDVVPSASEILYRDRA